MPGCCIDVSETDMLHAEGQQDFVIKIISNVTRQANRPRIEFPSSQSHGGCRLFRALSLVEATGAIVGNAIFLWDVEKRTRKVQDLINEKGNYPEHSEGNSLLILEHFWIHSRENHFGLLIG